MKRFDRWFPVLVLAALAVATLVSKGQDGDWLTGSIFAALLLAGAWAVSPLFGGRGATPWSSLRDRVGDGQVVIFWRPGCVYCLRLKATLGRNGRAAHWVNIWRDAEGAAFVRQHNHGNETVPTVLMGGGVLTNPDPRTINRALAGRQTPAS
jgi:glutaredoxin